MATPSALHIDICKFLIYHLQKHIAAQGLDWLVLAEAGVRTEIDGARIPDIIVCSRNAWEQVRSRPGSGVLDFGEAPLLILEVASTNWREDFIRKRSEYGSINIPEYCIVDSSKQRIRILTNPTHETGYEHIDFVPGQQIRFGQLPGLVLSVDDVLSPPNVEDLFKAENAQKQQMERQLAEERDRANQESQRANQESQRANQESQRAERLAALLRARGIDPDGFDE